MNLKKVLELPIELLPNCIYLVQDDDFVNIFVSSDDGRSVKKVLNISDVKELISSINLDAGDIIQFKDDLKALKTEQENMLVLLDTLNELDIGYLEQVKNIISNIQIELNNKIEESEIFELNNKVNRAINLVNSIDIDYLNSINNIIYNFGIEISDKVKYSDINIIISQINNINTILINKVDIDEFDILKSKIDNIDFSILEVYEQNIKLIIESLNQKANKSSYDEIINIVNELDERINNINGNEFKTKEMVQPKLVNSLPLYTLDNNGDYVLCKPDIWLEVNGYYIPAYTNTTLNIIK